MPSDELPLALLDGLDPYDELDREAARIDGFLTGLPDDAWTAPTGCADWDRRDLLAHLASTEDYHHACLDDALGEFLERGIASGATDLDSFNTWGLHQYDGWTPNALLAHWRARDAETRQRLRARDGGTMTTMVPDYPVRLQAFHVAQELATHADDFGIPIEPADAERRLEWRARFSRFVLAELGKNVLIEPCAEPLPGFRVAAGSEQAVVTPEELVAAAAARLPESTLSDALREALSTMP